MRFVALFAFAMLFGVTGCMEQRRHPPGFPIGRPSLSPDGRFIAFTYSRDLPHNKLLVFDTEKDILRVIKKPARTVLSGPSFAPDGKSLAVATFCEKDCAVGVGAYQIAIVNLASDEFRFMTTGRDYIRSYPIFSSDGQKVFFATRPLKWREDALANGLRWDADWGESQVVGYGGVSEINLRTQVERQIFPSKAIGLNFWSIIAGSVTSAGDMYLTAGRPMDERGKYIDAGFVRGGGKQYIIAGYIFHPPKDFKPLVQNLQWPMSSITSSSDGKKQVFISSPSDDEYNYDIFQIENGEVSQVTHLKSHMMNANVSARGNRVVFLADATRKRNWAVWLHDFSTGETREILSPDKLLNFLQSNDEQSTEDVHR